MKNVAIDEIVKKLIGPVYPTGEADEDKRRLDNLKELTMLIDRLLDYVESIIPDKERPEYSLRKAGEFAGKFFNERGIKR